MLAILLLLRQVLKSGNVDEALEILDSLIEEAKTSRK